MLWEATMKFRRWLFPMEYYEVAPWQMIEVLIRARKRRETLVADEAWKIYFKELEGVEHAE